MEFDHGERLNSLPTLRLSRAEEHATDFPGFGFLLVGASIWSWHEIESTEEQEGGGEEEKAEE